MSLEVWQHLYMAGEYCEVGVANNSLIELGALVERRSGVAGEGGRQFG